MSRRRCDAGDVIEYAFGLLGVLVLVALAIDGVRSRTSAPTVTIPATTATPPISAPVDVEPDEDRPVVNVVLRPARPKTACISDGARALCPPPETNFDALDAHCARKFLALVAREGAEDGPSPRDWSRYRAERFEAAARACPQEFER